MLRTLGDSAFRDDAQLDCLFVAAVELLGFALRPCMNVREPIWRMGEYDGEALQRALITKFLDYLDDAYRDVK